MEYVEGGTLLDHVKRVGKIDEDEARSAWLLLMETIAMTLKLLSLRYRSVNFQYC